MVARLGGGTVRVLPGTYRLRNSIFLRSQVRLEGSGAASVLFKEPSRTSKLAAGSDWYDQEITLADPAGFRVAEACSPARGPATGPTSPENGQTRSKRSRFITLPHAATKSRTNFSWPSPHA
jgi:hypothetical protein